MAIEEWGFGRMVVDGRAFTSDLIVHPDGRVADGWWRADGHRLEAADIAGLIEAGPEVIVAGLGIHGRMVPAAGLEAALERRGIELVAAANREAVAAFNRLCVARRTGGCFHLTC